MDRSRPNNGENRSDRTETVLVSLRGLKLPAGRWRERLKGVKLQNSRYSARRGRRHVVATLVLGALALPAVASAHLERPSYWPDPTPDTEVSPPAGGEVPKARSLGSAVTGDGPGKVRVVCQGNSLELAEK